MVLYGTRDNILELSKNLGRKTFWVPVLSDNKSHYLSNRISLVYIYSLDTEDEYLVGFNSNDLDRIDIEYFLGIIPPGHRIVYNAKYFTNYDFHCVDADMFIWYFTSKPLEIDRDFERIFNFYKTKYPSLVNINDVVPVMRILEYCREVRNQFLRYYENQEDDGYQFYENVYRRNLLQLERSRITVDPVRYRDLSGRDIKESYVFGEYNPYTATGRPSHYTDGVNFNSLNKTDGSREMIVSGFENGRLFEFDYDSYHLRLIASIIGYEFPPGNVHEHFARQYFNTPNVTPDQYIKSKKITFRQLYWEISPEYKHIDFFAKYDKFFEVWWDMYERDGYFISPLSKRKFYAEWFSDMTKMKMINYIIQCVETEVNMMVLEKILQYLYQVKSKIILYAYDAILIDYNPEDGIEVLKDVKSLMSRFGYPVKVKAGVNYHEMMDVEIN